MKRLISIAGAMFLLVGALALPAGAAANQGEIDFSITQDNDWGNACTGEVVTLTTTSHATGSFVIDANGSVHVHWQNVLVDGIDNNGWEVTRYVVNQGHQGDDFNWLDGSPAKYNLHLEVSDPNSDRAYTGNLIVVWTTGPDGARVLTANNSTFNCIRSNS